MSTLWSKFKQVLGYEKKKQLPAKLKLRLKKLMNSKLTEQQKKDITSEVKSKVDLKEHNDNDGNPLCQALTMNGTRCKNHVYINFNLYGCCKLCRQHALMYMIYIAFIITKKVGTMHLDNDMYCTYYPEECYDDKNLPKI